jgi:hypothetical protein
MYVCAPRRHVCCKAKKYAAKARKFFITAQKSRAEFNAFCLRRSLLEFGFDVHSSLQVKPCTMFDCVAFSFDLHNRDHVKPLALLISFRFKLSGIRRILLNLIDDHVKHVSEHVKLRRARVVLGRGHNRTERGSAGSTASTVVHWKFDPALPRSVLC